MKISVNKALRAAVRSGAVLLVSLMLWGCKSAEKDTQIVLTTPFAEDEVFRIDEKSCYLPEVRVYMKQAQEQYEGLFGEEIWEKDLGDMTMGEQLKDTILARLAQLKVMSLLAADHEITLTPGELEEARAAADKYADEVSDKVLSDIGADRELLTQMYSEYTLAQKVYDSLTANVNPEISDDEARTIRIKHIMIKTCLTDVSGNRVPYGPADKKKARRQIESIRDRLSDGEDFDQLAERYNEDTKTTYSFMKGDMPEPFEEAAFDLDTDEISGIIETEYGYHIIKCISTFDRDETDRNKLNIVRERKNEAFNEVYSAFVKTVHSNLNEELWDGITL